MRTPSYIFASICFVSGIFLGATTIAFAISTGGSSKFPDVPFNSYYDSAVGEMAELGVIRGRPDGTFDPAAPATRADIAVMLQRLRNSILAEESASSSTNNDSSSSSNEDSSSSSSNNTSTTTPSEGAVRFTLGNFNVQEDAGTAKITLIRTGGSEGNISVHYVLESGSATEGEDYENKNGTLTFADGETSRMFTITIFDDDIDEGNENLTMRISDPAGGAILSVPNVATITIQDDDDTQSSTSDITDGQHFRFSALAYAVAENNGSIAITVERLGGSDGTATVEYATADDTARFISDYDTTNGTLTFADGQTEKTFTVNIDDDQNTEGNEIITLTLKNPSGATIDTPTSVDLTIVDDEVTAFGTGALRLDASSYEVLKSSDNVVITIERRGGGYGEFQVDYETRNGTAKSGSDYEETSGVLTFRYGEIEKTIIIPILDDGAEGLNESFTFILSDPTHGATLDAPASASINILQ